MRTIGLPGVSFGGVSRGDGWSATGRSQYQMGMEVHDGVPEEKHRNGHRIEHVQQWLLLPDGVDPSLWSRESIWNAAGIDEKRKDAREGRYFDVTWPRDLPTTEIEKLVRALFDPLLKMGLVVQLDWKSSPASDGLPNDHLHGLISTRRLSNTGFAKSKCRELDVWFRAGVRQRLTEHFNAIAENCSIDVRFDPRPNVERQDAFPPEDRLSRRIVRDVNSPGRTAIMERRDQHRQWRREHERLMVEMANLEQSALDLRAEIDAELQDMSVLTSWQQEGKAAQPLALEIAMTAFMGAGIPVEDRMMIEGIGAAFVVNSATLIDAGDRILFQGELEDNAVRALHLLARCKGWRNLSLVDEFGMPLPVPSEPDRRSQQVVDATISRTAFDDRGKHDVIQAAREVVRELATASPAQRQEMLGRVIRWGNPRLEWLVAQLAARAADRSSDPISGATIFAMITEAVGSDGGLWRRYALEQDLIAMTVPGNALSRPFRPHPNFYRHFPMPSSDEHGYGAGEGGGQ